MGAEVFLIYYDDGEEPEPSPPSFVRQVLSELRAQAADWLFVCSLAAAVIILSDRW